VQNLQTIGVYGAGAWGLALALAAYRAGRRVVVVGRGEAAMAGLAASRVSAKLPTAHLPEDIVVSASPDALEACEALLIVTPAQALSASLEVLGALAASKPLVLCAKGIERDTHRFLSDIAAALAPMAPIACLSGPSFAHDVAAGLPTAVTLAAREERLAAALCRALHGPALRLYASSDVRGVEIGGAAKNVLAIACGVADGLSLGASAQAALVARGFAELSRFGEAYGARPETLMGLSGLGDLVLTCTSPQSRNFAYGVALGRGEPTAHMPLAEGVHTARALCALANRRGVEMPIAQAVVDVLEGRVGPTDAVRALLARPSRKET
jgi:glycerol-3-phosphate dehydrogenase (NAD(P)+)